MTLTVAETHNIATGCYEPMYSSAPLVERRGQLWATWMQTDGHSYMGEVGGDPASVERISTEPVREPSHNGPAIGVQDDAIVVAWSGQDRTFLYNSYYRSQTPLDCMIAFDLAFDGPHLLAQGGLTDRDGFDVLQFGPEGNGRKLINGRSLPYGYEQVEFRRRANRIVWAANTSPWQIYNGPLCAAEVDSRGRMRPLDRSRPWTSGPLDAQAEAYRIWAGDVDQGTECAWDLTPDGRLAILLKLPVTGTVERGRVNAKSPTYTCTAQMMVGGELYPPLSGAWPGNWAFQQPVVWCSPAGRVYVIMANGEMHAREIGAADWQWSIAPADGLVGYRLADGRLALVAYDRGPAQALKVVIVEETP